MLFIDKFLISEMARIIDHIEVEYDINKYEGNYKKLMNELKKIVEESDKYIERHKTIGKTGNDMEINDLDWEKIKEHILIKNVVFYDIRLIKNILTKFPFSES